MVKYPIFDRFLKWLPCLVPRPRYYARPMRFGSRGPRKFLRPRQTRRSETFCLTWGGAFGSGRAVNNFSALMKDVQQPWRVQRILVHRNRREASKLVLLHGATRFQLALVSQWTVATILGLHSRDGIER